MNILKYTQSAGASQNFNRKEREENYAKNAKKCWRMASITLCGLCEIITLYYQILAPKGWGRLLAEQVDQDVPENNHLNTIAVFEGLTEKSKH